MGILRKNLLLFFCTFKNWGFLSHFFSNPHPDLLLKMEPSLASRHHSPSKIDNVLTKKKTNVNWNCFLFHFFLAIYILPIPVCDYRSVPSPWMFFSCFQQGTLIIIIQFVVTYRLFSGIPLIQHFPIS